MEKLTVTAHVVSASDLTEEQISALQTVLEKKTGKGVRLSVKIDPSLICGLYINVDGYAIDSTVKKQLRDMKSTLKKGGAI